MYYFKQVVDGEIVSVEAKSCDVVSPFFVKATEAEYNNFIVSLSPPIPSKPPRDLKVEIDEIKAMLGMKLVGE